MILYLLLLPLSLKVKVEPSFRAAYFHLANGIDEYLYQYIKCGMKPTIVGGSAGFHYLDINLVTFTDPNNICFTTMLHLFWICHATIAKILQKF